MLMSEQYYSNRDGLVSLAVELVNQARRDYYNRIEDGDYIGARILAERDSRGIIGYILAWATNDNQYLFKEVLRKTDKFLVD